MAKAIFPRNVGSVAPCGPRSHTLRASHSENGVEDEEDLYACVYEDEEGGEIYEDLMKTEAIPPPVCVPSVTSISRPDGETV